MHFRAYNQKQKVWWNNTGICIALHPLDKSKQPDTKIYIAIWKIYFRSSLCISALIFCSYYPNCFFLAGKSQQHHGPGYVEYVQRMHNYKPAKYVGISLKVKVKYWNKENMFCVSIFIFQKHVFQRSSVQFMIVRTFFVWW